MIEGLKITLGGTSDGFRTVAPERCWRCPVVSCLEFAGRDSARASERFSKTAERAHNKLADFKLPPSHERSVRVELEQAEQLRDKYSQKSIDCSVAVGELVAKGNLENCTGAAVGDLTEGDGLITRAFTALNGWSLLPLVRTCTNPQFDQLRYDPTVAEAMDCGPWVARVDG